MSDIGSRLRRHENVDFLEVAPVRIEQLVHSAVRRWAPTADRDWRVEPAASGWMLLDEERIGTAIDALIENALKHTRDGDRITISAAGDGQDVLLEIADTGVGIAEEDLERIFERFARSDRDRSRSSGGTGLGLAIVKAIAETHDGSVGVRAEVGRGSTFSIRVPGFRADPPSTNGSTPAAAVHESWALEDLNL